MNSFTMKFNEILLTVLSIGDIPGDYDRIKLLMKLLKQVSDGRETCYYTQSSSNIFLVSLGHLTANEGIESCCYSQLNMFFLLLCF